MYRPLYNDGSRELATIEKILIWIPDGIWNSYVVTNIPGWLDSNFIILQINDDSCIMIILFYNWWVHLFSWLYLLLFDSHNLTVKCFAHLWKAFNSLTLRYLQPVQFYILFSFCYVHGSFKLTCNLQEGSTNV